MKMLVYSVEDDSDIALIINKTLSKQGYIVETFNTGKAFWTAFIEKKPSIILLDLMLPDESGVEILKKIRSNSLYNNIHIIIVSAKHMILDKVEGLDCGADDYIEKPFDLLELMARVDAQARRVNNDKTLNVGDIFLDIDKRICKYQNREIELTGKEFDILNALVTNSPNIVKREELFDLIWGSDKIVESRTLDMHIKSLRKKFNDDGNLIKSIYGVGYKLNI